MKRTITLVQRRGKEMVMSGLGTDRPPKKSSAACLVCRNSRTEIKDGRFTVTCKLGMGIGAENCPNFRDSRCALAGNYLHGIVANG